jgi:hypothetical protein
MVEETIYDGVGDLIKSFFEEALARHWNKMMDNFSRFLRRLPMMTDAHSTSSDFEGETPFKVQVNFDVPLFAS